MSVSLAEALGQVELEAGQIYRCEVNGNLVELRVLRPDRAISVDDPGPMLDPWVTLPRPTPVARVTAKVVPMPLPASPEIPQDEDGE